MRQKYLLKLFCVVSFILVAFTMKASIGVTDLITFTQPNGKKLKVKIMGDEYMRYYTTEDNYVITQNNENFFVYASYDNNYEIVPGKQIANNIGEREAGEKQFLASRTIGLPTTTESVMQQNAAHTRSLNALAASGAAPFPTIGKHRTLVILAEFSDKKFSVPNPNHAFNALLNENGYNNDGAIGSAHDYFYENSSGLLDLQFDVCGPVTLPNTLAFYGANIGGNDGHLKELAIDACSAVEKELSINFSIYDINKDNVLDNVFIIYAGYDEAQGGGGDAIWSQRPLYNNSLGLFGGKELRHFTVTSELHGNTSSIPARIGTFCHEFGHVLGIPDLYNTARGSSVVQRYFLMDSGNFNDSNRIPPSLSALERMLCGWIEPKVIPSNSAFINLWDIGKNQAYRINTDTENEFFLLEYRAPQRWDNTNDIARYGYGLLIYHIDRSYAYIDRWNVLNPSVTPFNKINANSNHYCCYVKQASSTIWTFNENTITSFNDTTTPSAYSWNNISIKRPISNIKKIDKLMTFEVNGNTRYILGDSNCDGVITILDIVATIAYINNTPFDLFDIRAVDVNNDNIINVSDLVATIEIILKQ